MAPGASPLAREPQRSGRWVGRGASAGHAVGPARVLRSDADLVDCGAGEILVMRHATPGVAGAATGAAGLVSETGGLLSHLAVLARELGTPCVTGVAGIVDAVESGVRVSLDGLSGRVDVFGATRAASPPPPAPGPLTPILRFGRFSPTFRCVDAHLTPEAVVRAVSLAVLPSVLGHGAPLALTFEDNVALVETHALRRLGDDLASRLETEPGVAARMRATYEESLAWAGWHDTRPDAACALKHFVLLNALTWAAALVKEQLADRLRVALHEEVSDARRVDELLLAALTMPGASYLLSRTRVGTDPEASVQPGLAPEISARTRVLRDLVVLTEDKNTRLARLAAVMGGLPVASALGLAEAELGDDGTAEGRAAMVARVLGALPRPELPL